jgi:hypothetical protein
MTPSGVYGISESAFRAVDGLPQRESLARALRKNVADTA